MGTPSPDPWKGIVAGLAGGAAGCLAVYACRGAFWGAGRARSEWRLRHQAPLPYASSGQEPSRSHVQRWPEDEQEEPPPPMVDEPAGPDAPVEARAIEELSERLLHRQLPERNAKVAGGALNATLSLAAGASYGLAAEHFPAITAGEGLAFGTSMMLSVDEGAASAMGLQPLPQRRNVASHLNSLVQYLVFGLTCELVRGATRQLLDK